MTMTSVRGYSYNPMTNTLSLSESFVKKASRLGTAEYKLVLQYQKDHPDLKMVEMEKKTSEKKIENVSYRTIWSRNIASRVWNRSGQPTSKCS